MFINSKSNMTMTIRGSQGKEGRVRKWLMRPIQVRKLLLQYENQWVGGIPAALISWSCRAFLLIKLCQIGLSNTKFSHVAMLI